MIPLLIAIILLVSWLMLRYSFLLPRVSGIPVLMFHRVIPNESNYLTLLPQDFERNLDWLSQSGFQSISLETFLSFARKDLPRESLPKKPFLITFDDGYACNLSVVLPILQKRNLSACIFVTTQYIEARETGTDVKYLSIAELQKWQTAGMELALHSDSHPNYKTTPLEQIEKDLDLNRKKLKSWNLRYIESLAYPFGGRPKDPRQREELKTRLVGLKLNSAFRIGNRIHRWSEFERGVDLFDLCRIDIRGDDPFFEFKIKIKKGRSKRL